MRYQRVFCNNPSPHYEDWVILDMDEVPTLEEIDRCRRDIDKNDKVKSFQHQKEKRQ